MLPTFVTVVVVLTLIGTAVGGAGVAWPGVAPGGVGERPVGPRLVSLGYPLGTVDTAVPDAGPRLQADTAAVLFLNQSTDGQSVTVARAHLPRGGFVSVHDSTLLDGAAISSIRGTSGYLDSGSHSGVTVRLDEPIATSRTLIAVPYTDTNDNEVYDYASSRGTEDVPYESDRGGVVMDDATVTVLEVNKSPTAVLQYSPLDPRPGETVVFDAFDSADPDGRIVSYDWRIRSREPPLLVTFRSEVSTTFDHPFSDPGEYDVTLAVEDDGGARDSVSATIVVRENAPPTADFEFAPADPEVGETVGFDGTVSTDDRGVVSYLWELDGDGEFDADGSRTSRQFDAAGRYPVTLLVSDGEGATDRTTRVVVVREANVPPVAAFEFTPGVPLAGETVTFDATGATDDGEIRAYRWDLDGDGEFESTGRLVDRRYPSGETFVVSLLVVDDGGLTDTANATVRINEPPEPAFRVDPSPAVVGQPANFDAAASTDDRRIVSHEWDLDGDGSGDATGQVVRHTFETAGERTVGLTVRDDDGVTVRTTLTVTVVASPTREPTPTQPAAETSTPSQTTTETTETTSPTPTVVATSTPPVRGGGGWPLPGTPEEGAAVGGIALVVALAALFRDELVAALRGLRLPRSGQTTPRGGRTRTVSDPPDPDEAEADEEDEPNRPPTASVRHTPEEPIVGQPVMFDGRGSTDSDGRVTTYRWSGDGPERSGSVVVHTFEESGEHEVTLAVEDDEGAVGEATVTVDVEPAPGELALLEAHPDSPGRDHDSLDLEYLVFGNVGEGPLDIAGWTVHDAAEEEDRVREGEHTYAFDEALELEPESTVILHTGSGPDGAPALDTDGAHHRYWGRTWPVWNNEGDVVVVKDGDANPVLAVRYARHGDGYAVEPLDQERLEQLFPGAPLRTDAGEAVGVEGDGDDGEGDGA